MKKQISLLIATMLFVSVSACGKNAAYKAREINAEGVAGTAIEGLAVSEGRVNVLSAGGNGMHVYNLSFNGDDVRDTALDYGETTNITAFTVDASGNYFVLVNAGEEEADAATDPVPEEARTTLQDAVTVTKHAYRMPWYGGSPLDIPEETGPRSPEEDDGTYVQPAGDPNYGPWLDADESELNPSEDYGPWNDPNPGGGGSQDRSGYGPWMESEEVENPTGGPDSAGPSSSGSGVSSSDSSASSTGSSSSSAGSSTSSAGSSSSSAGSSTSSVGSSDSSSGSSASSSGSSASSSGASTTSSPAGGQSSADSSSAGATATSANDTAAQGTSGAAGSSSSGGTSGAETSDAADSAGTEAGSNGGSSDDAGSEPVMQETDGDVTENEEGTDNGEEINPDADSLSAQMPGTAVLVKFDSNGTLQWQTATDTTASSVAVTTDGRTVVAGGSHVAIYESENGARIGGWNYETEDFLISHTVALRDGRVLFAGNLSGDGTNAYLTQINADGIVSEPVSLPFETGNALLFAGTENDMLIADGEQISSYNIGEKKTNNLLRLTDTEPSPGKASLIADLGSSGMIVAGNHAEEGVLYLLSKE